MQKLKKLRMLTGMSQTELAQRVGISSGHISRLETDPFIKFQPKLLEKLALALGCTEKEICESPSNCQSLKEYLEKKNKNLSRGERSILYAYMKFGRSNRRKLVEIMRKLDVCDENSAT